MDFKKILGTLSMGAVLVSAGCVPANTTSEGGEPEAEIQKDIVIGGLSPLTGDASSYGIEFQRMAELALEDVNAAWAENGMTLDIQWEDGACNGEDASTGAQKLIDVDKVEVILGGFCSSETLAAAAITDPAGVILFSPGSSSPDVTTAGNYVFRNWPSDAFQGQKLAELADELGFEKVAMISEQQDYTAGIAKVFTEEFSGEVVEEKFLSEDTDVKTQLTKLMNEGVDAYFVNPQTPVKGDLIFKQMQELGIEGPFLLNDVAGTSTDLLDPYADYLEESYTATVNIDNEAEDVVAIQDRYKEKYGEEIAYLAYGVSSYDAVWILAKALTEGGNDGDAIKNYLNDFPGYTGLMGSIDFDDNGDPLVGHSVFTIESGELVLQ